MCIICGRRCTQVIPVKGMSLVSRSAGPAGEAFAAAGGGEGGITRLAPLPYAQQAARPRRPQRAGGRAGDGGAHPQLAGAAPAVGL